MTGKYQAGCITIVKIQLKDGTFHEDMGYSYTEGSTKGSAVQKSRLVSYFCLLFSEFNIKLISLCTLLFHFRVHTVLHSNEHYHVLVLKLIIKSTDYPMESAVQFQLK